ncbi:transposase [Dactylosporangium sp. CS-033363]|uniref:transposase n=1 Tax=Dactylosporangium sp. CS-033363 TaxID=3239935 RepID=UPI003D94976F
MLCFLDNTREALAGLRREGRAGSNTIADHITVLDAALTQIPDPHRHGVPILIRSDSVGCTFGLLAHIRGLRELGLDSRFSVGAAITETLRQAILTAERRPGDWVPAVDADGEPRDNAEVCELTDLVPDNGYPSGTRFIVRRERPHPGAQLSLFDTIEGMRHQVMATDTPPGPHQRPDPIPRSPPPRPRPGRRLHPLRQSHRLRSVPVPVMTFAINQAWLHLALTGIDLLAWTQMLLLDGELATAEPKKLRYRLLHTAARITRTARQTRLRIVATWPWPTDLTTAFTRPSHCPSQPPEPGTPSGPHPAGPPTKDQLIGTQP